MADLIPPDWGGMVLPFSSLRNGITTLMPMMEIMMNASTKIVTIIFLPLDSYMSQIERTICAKRHMATIPPNGGMALAKNEPAGASSRASHQQEISMT